MDTNQNTLKLNVMTVNIKNKINFTIVTFLSQFDGKNLIQNVQSLE